MQYRPSLTCWVKLPVHPKRGIAVKGLAGHEVITSYTEATARASSRRELHYPDDLAHVRSCGDPGCHGAPHGAPRRWGWRAAHRGGELNPLIPERIRSGEPYDIGLTNPPYAKTLINNGFADGGSHRAFGRVSLAIARRGEAHGEIIADSNGIEALLRSAKSIAYTGPGTSGRTYLDAIERMGLTGPFLPPSHALAGGVPAALVAAGEYELAIAPLTTVIATPGVGPAAVFPEHLGTHIDMSIFRNAVSPIAAETVIDILTGHGFDDELAAAGIARFELT